MGVRWHWTTVMHHFIAFSRVRCVEENEDRHTPSAAKRQPCVCRFQRWQIVHKFAVWVTFTQISKQAIKRHWISQKRYNTIQYKKTYKAPYVTKKLFVGAGKYKIDTWLLHTTITKWYVAYCKSLFTILMVAQQLLSCAVAVSLSDLWRSFHVG